MTTTALPTSSDVKQAELDTLQRLALALRDLYETADAHAATITIDGGTLVCDQDGCHLVPIDGEPVDLTEWVDYTGLVPA